MPENISHKKPQLQIEVAYALPKQQTLLSIQVSEGSTVNQAIEESEILTRHPEINLSESKVGIFSKACQLSDVLHDGDRVEIYRPLVADPKEIRKARAAEQKKNNAK